MNINDFLKMNPLIAYLKYKDFSTYMHYDALLRHGYTIIKVYVKNVCLVIDSNYGYFIAKSHLKVNDKKFNNYASSKTGRKSDYFLEA